MGPALEVICGETGVGRETELEARSRHDRWYGRLQPGAAARRLLFRSKRCTDTALAT